MSSTRAHIAQLEKEQTDRAAGIAALRALETAEQARAQAQAEATAAQQALAALKASVRAEEATLAQQQEAVAEARAVLRALGTEKAALERELYSVRQHGEQWTRDFVAQLHGIVPTEPAPTLEEAARE